jgi:hypothetical protein
MEHAIWMKKTDEREYISIKEIKGKLGADAARCEKYRCPSSKCGVKMITVFPHRIRHDGKEAHSDHFRANPEPHKGACEGDGERLDMFEPAIGNETDTKPRHEVVRRGSYPMVYVKGHRRSQKVSSRKMINGVRESGEDGLKKEIEVNGTLPGIHMSAPETGHIRRIVEAYENPPIELSNMEVFLPDCPARNYHDAFRDVTRAVDSEGRLRANYIYKGSYREHHISVNNSIVIIFSDRSDNGRNFCVWVKPELKPDAKRGEIKSLLARAAVRKDATVYVFGRFHPFGDSEYRREIEAFGDLWITFPANSNAVT